jgi:DNA-binding HxlR family transcriptional regulator
VSGTPEAPNQVLVRLTFDAFPLQSSLGVLGRRWALLILMNIALSRAQRFNELLRGTPGMSKRILAMRLAEMERAGFISRAEQGPKFTRWQLTAKGADVLPVLLTLIHFSAKCRTPPDPGVAASASWGPRFDVSYSDPARTAGRRGEPPRRRSTRPRAG